MRHINCFCPTRPCTSGRLFPALCCQSTTINEVSAFSGNKEMDTKLHSCNINKGHLTFCSFSVFQRCLKIKGDSGGVSAD